MRVQPTLEEVIMGILYSACGFQLHFENSMFYETYHVV